MTTLLLLLLVQAPPSSASCLAVSGDEIYNRDLARFVPAFGALDPAGRVGFAPVPGTRRILSPGEIANLARRAGLALSSPAPAACFERPTQILSRAQIEEALHQALARKPGETGSPIDVEVVDYSRYPVPLGSIEFPRSGLSYPLRGDANVAVEWLGRLRYGNGQAATIWARVKLKTVREVLVAAGPLIAGAAIEPGQVRLEPRAVFPFPETGVLAPEEAAGRIPRRSIAQGEIVNAAYLTAAPAVRRGDEVAVRYQDGSLLLRFPATAGATGQIGDAIVVENESSHVRLRGVIEARGQVLVKVAEKEER
jgi:flagella basal body P-ring formation protein FlgA